MAPMTFLAHRLLNIKPSPTLAMTAKAAKMKAEGRSILSLSAGEPDFDTPESIKQAAQEAMAQGLTKYTPVDGLPALKKAIQQKFLRDNQLTYDLSEITVSNGGKQVIFNALMATLNAGDEVIIPAPYWVSYPDIVLLFGGCPKIITCAQGQNFKMTGAQLEQAITPHTKWVILNSPSNPTGEVYTRAEMMDLARVLQHYPYINILSDDIYEYLVYEDITFTSILDVAPDLKERTLIVNGVSKSYSMTGWRIGYGAGPKPLIQAMTMLQSQSTSNACSIAQAAAIEAINGDQSFIKDWRDSFARRRDLAVDLFNQIPGLSCTKPGGAFYLYINCQGLIGKRTPEGVELVSDDDIAIYLLEHAEVAVVAGSGFGLSPYFRISYATSTEIIQETCQRIGQAVQKLQ
jgi:aspartate aminotransferase